MVKRIETMNLEFLVNNSDNNLFKYVNKSTSTPFLYKHYKSINISHEEVFNQIVNHLANSDLILIGGQTAHERFYGYRNLRKPSTDIDVYVNNDKFIKVLDRERLSYYTPYNTLIYFNDTLPIVIHYKKIHDYEPDETFFKTIRVIYNVRINSPEYTIALKMKRADDNKKFLGKDKTDIANILLSYLFDKLDLNLNLLKDLLKKFNIKREMLKEIVTINQLNKKEKEELDYLIKYLSK